MALTLKAKGFGHLINNVEDVKRWKSFIRWLRTYYKVFRDNAKAAVMEAATICSTAGYIPNVSVFDEPTMVWDEIAHAVRKNKSAFEKKSPEHITGRLQST